MLIFLVRRFRPRAAQPGLSPVECFLLAFLPWALWFVPAWRRG